MGLRRFAKPIETCTPKTELYVNFKTIKQDVGGAVRDKGDCPGGPVAIPLTPGTPCVDRRSVWTLSSGWSAHSPWGRLAVLKLYVDRC